MTTVLVLRGGKGSHDVSLKTGNAALTALSEPYKLIDVFVDRNLVWHVRGLPIAPERALQSADLVFNALHGEYGEDGTVQKILERSGVPHTGSGSFSSAVAMNKVLAKWLMEKEGIKVPRHVILNVSPDLERDAIAAFRKFSPPVVIKPVASGISAGVTLAKTFAEFWEGVKKAFTFGTHVMAEEYVMGKEASVGVIDTLRGSERYALMPVEVVRPSQFSIFSDEQKEKGSASLRVPSGFAKSEVEELERLARLAHERLGLAHYSRSDFIVSSRGIYFLEANALPPLGAGTVFSESLSAAGISPKEFFTHLLTIAPHR